MINHDTVQPNPRQRQEFMAAVVADLPEMTADQMQYWIRRKGRNGQLAEALHRALVPAGSTLTDWERFLDKHFGMRLDLSGLIIPKHRSGFDRIIVVPPGLGIYELVEICRDKFTVCIDAEGGVTATADARVAHDKPYAISIRDRVEADEELGGLSAKLLDEQGITGITLLERLILELKYYDETGKHLDLSNITLCSGSRQPGGYAPSVHTHRNEIQVSWCAPDDGARCPGAPRSTNYSLRTREVVA